AFSELPESPGKVAITPGSRSRSEMFHRILSDDPEYMMPSPESNLQLSPREKAILIKWIEEGAVYKRHWAFIKPSERALPKMDHKGLPPSIDEIKTFMADTSSNAYEKMVDAFLASPHYGEKMAMHWMDIARFADTHGYTVDRYRDMSPYRDWVIKAYNENLPYHQFITYQLAGDLLPHPTREQMLATAFNRIHPQNMEGGIVEEEFRVEYVVDRTHTLGQAFLAM